ncbi:hypothetical protein [[Phormidium] sp. ETS-05]|uniref:hypothetical protein n=1 Tax=[Phormidium] sp. ETS-05 TaxID=222819 RepID=UPI0018EEDA1D|nr:hypothetical protein [[Phormidium] sp. ETS-05]
MRINSAKAKSTAEKAGFCVCWNPLESLGGWVGPIVPGVLTTGSLAAPHPEKGFLYRLF